MRRCLMLRQMVTKLDNRLWKQSSPINDLVYPSFGRRRGLYSSLEALSDTIEKATQEGDRDGSDQ